MTAAELISLLAGLAFGAIIARTFNPYARRCAELMAHGARLVELWEEEAYLHQALFLYVDSQDNCIMEQYAAEVLERLDREGYLPNERKLRSRISQEKKVQKKHRR